jgi:DNA-binding transcriptional LysR family regulator
MNTRNFLYVLTVAEEKSFSKAAKKLYIAQPSLSQYISAIEQDVGSKLFNRSTIPLSLTYAGERFLAAAKRILTIEKNLQRELEDIAGNNRGRINIGITLHWGRYIFPAVFSSFKREFPGIEIQLLERTGNQLTELVLDGKVDLILCNQSHQTEMNDALEYIQVYEDDVVLVAPFSHETIDTTAVVAKKRPEINLETIKNEPFILLTPEQGLRKVADYICHMYKITPNILLETQNLETALSLASEGMGFTFIPASFIQYIKPQCQAMCFGFDKGSFKHIMSICYRKDLYLSKPLLYFIQLIQGHFSAIAS